MPYSPLNIPLSKIITEHTRNGIYHEEAFDTIEIEYDEFQAAATDIRERLKVKLQSGKFSDVLVNQLARHQLNIYEKFGNEVHAYHFQTVLDMIEKVDKGFAMNVRPFTRQPLAGFKHFHHSSNTFPALNILNVWIKKFGKADEVTYQNGLLTNIYNKLLGTFSPEDAQKKALTILLGEIQNEARYRPLNRQTGEWVIFKQHNGINYFLCLATHQEAQDFGDTVIYDRLKPCFSEFPVLNQ